jgi:hypothetical protein
MVGINKLKLVSKFYRIHSKNDRSCIFVHKELNPREIAFLNYLSHEKHFEISGVEIVKFK